MTAPGEHAMCPYLVPIVADNLCLYPQSAFCRRPGERLRFPLRATLATVCTMETFSDCVGYRTAVAREHARGHEASSD
jgi:hypothetical protein